MTQVFGGKKFEALFRNAAGLNMDKSDIKRLYEVVNQKMHDLLQMGEVAAQANDRDVIQLYDLPITKEGSMPGAMVAINLSLRPKH